MHQSEFEAKFGADNVVRLERASSFRRLSRINIATIKLLAENLAKLSAGQFDYVVIDEFHHAAAKSYRRLIECIQPGFLLGLTATPFRGDRQDILQLCSGNVIVIPSQRIARVSAESSASSGMPEELENTLLSRDGGLDCVPAPVDLRFVPSPRHRHYAPQTRFCTLVAQDALEYFAAMKTLTVEEAVAGLGRWLDRALAGEQIQIRKGDAVVELRPTQPAQSAVTESLSPREALRRLQADARLQPEEAERYLREVLEERLAAENRRPA